ncbi:MAG: S49 family peptidase [Planctomycetota bacterium]
MSSMFYRSFFAVSVLALAVAGPGVSAQAEGPFVGWIELSDELRQGPVPFAWVTEAEAGPSLSTVLGQMDHVAQSDDYLGLTIYLDQPALTFAQAGAIRGGIAKVREAGKKVLVFAETYDLLDLYLASSADRVLLQKKGSVELSGLAVEEMYLADTLGKLGVRADLVQIGKYKGADEQLVRTEPSPEWDENINGLLDGLYAHLIETVSAGRGMTVQEFEGKMAETMAMTDEQVLAAGLIDGVAARSLYEPTGAAFGDDFTWDSNLGAGTGAAMPDNPFALFSMLFEPQKPRTRRATLAVVHAYGPITSGDSSLGDGFTSESTIGSATIERALIDALEDENVKAVLLRIDSPGGSALASEMIWQAMREVAADKPVFASVGSMAASGGYYLVCGAERVFVEPTSIVGSIGVVGGKFVMKGLYDWAGIRVTRRTRGPGGDLFNSVEPFDEQQRQLVRRSMQVIYDQFRDRIRIGRGDRLTDLDAVDEGLLFTGAQAVENGMADDLGGLDAALAALAQRVELEDGEYDVIDLPLPLSLPEYLNEVFGVASPRLQAAAPELAALRKLLGEARWRGAAALLDGMAQLRHEPVLLLHPSAVHVTTGGR